MPTYEYMCGNCGRFEEFQSIKAAPLAACPKCGGKVTRLISAGGGMIFKGSGSATGQAKATDAAPAAKPEGAKQPEKKTGDASAGGNGSSKKGEKAT